jgi:branched-chain amino acid aminotransferase
MTDTATESRTLTLQTAPAVPGDVIQYSEYALDPANPLHGGCAYANGEFVPAADARISLFDAGFAHGDMTYTVAATWHGGLFRLDDHVDRLLWGAGQMDIASPLSHAELKNVMIEMTARSGLREAFTWIVISRGIHLLDVNDMVNVAPTVWAYATPYPWHVKPADQIGGVSAIVAEKVRRSSALTIDPKVKNLQWGDLSRAKQEAQAKGAYKAFLLDSDGFLTEGPGFNVLTVKDGAVRTPGRNCLPGITRRTVLELAGGLGIPAAITDVSLAELRDADEIFITTTAGGVMPIVELDGAAVGAGVPGPVTTAIRQAYWPLLDDPAYRTEVPYAEFA